MFQYRWNWYLVQQIMPHCKQTTSHQVYSYFRLAYPMWLTIFTHYFQLRERERERERADSLKT
jgi:hypothetical protein